MYLQLFAICMNAMLQIIYVVLVPYMDRALNMDTPNILKIKKIYRYMALRARK